MPSFETPQPVDLTVELFLGDVRVTASDRTTTVVDVRPSNPNRAADVEAAAATIVEHHAGRVHVRAPKTWRRFTPFDKNGSVQVVVDVPTGSNLVADTSMGDVQGEGELGACQVKTSMGRIRLDHAGDVGARSSFGDVTIDRTAGTLDASTGSGDVRIGDVRGPATIKNANGTTRVGSLGGESRVKSSNGDITVEVAAASLTARTANGNLRVGSVRRGVVILETSAGDVDCAIAEGTAALLDVRSTFGRVRSDLEQASGPAPTDETVELRVQTSYGDITIRRAELPHAHTTA